MDMQLDFANYLFSKHRVIARTIGIFFYKCFLVNKTTIFLNKVINRF